MGLKSHQTIALVSVQNVEEASVLTVTNTAVPTIAENVTAQTDTGVTFTVTDDDE